MSSTTEAKTKTKKVAYMKGYVNCSLLNVRKEPNINSEIVMRLTKGTSVEISSKKNDKEFYAVNVLGTICYVKKEFIDLEDS